MRSFSLFRRKKPPQALQQPTTVSTSPDEDLQPIVLRTLVIVFDPVVGPAGKKLSEHMHWNRVEDLMAGFRSDIEQVSSGLVRYQIVERIDVDDFPVKIDGFAYNAKTYLNMWGRQTPAHVPDEADYHAVVDHFEILQRVAKHEIDEVWLFGFPYAGFYESRMAGPGAFWCNAPPLTNTEAAGRRFVIMGFSYERGVGEMLENMGHRAESIMEKTFERLTGNDNLWRRFTRYEKTHPGRAALGNVHFAPNSERDYDWGNPAIVMSECDDWLDNFPNFKGVTRKVTAAEWGYGDIRKHHIWWMKHFPKTKGQANGIYHNWWQYIADPNHVNL
jgi:hypothetical protein